MPVATIVAMKPSLDESALLPTTPHRRDHRRTHSRAPALHDRQPVRPRPRHHHLLWPRHQHPWRELRPLLRRCRRRGPHRQRPVPSANLGDEGGRVLSPSSASASPSSSCSSRTYSKGARRPLRRPEHRGQHRASVGHHPGEVLALALQLRLAHDPGVGGVVVLPGDTWSDSAAPAPATCTDALSPRGNLGPGGFRHDPLAMVLSLACTAARSCWMLARMRYSSSSSSDSTASRSLNVSTVSLP